MKVAITLFVSLFFISSCGGGSGSAPAPDRIKPTVTAPAPITVAAINATGTPASNASIAAFLAAATATDNVGVAGGVTNNAPVTFPLGITNVTFTATDAAGNTGTSSSTVTIVDQAPPVISIIPFNTSHSPTGAYIASKIAGSSGNRTDLQIMGLVNNSTAVDNVDGALPTTNNAPVIFPLGLTNVTVSATDVAGNTGTASIPVTIKREWKWANPKHNGEPLNDVVWAGQYVAVGYAGNIMTSPDGSVWSSRKSGISQSLNGIAWSGTLLVAVGFGGAVITSPDAITWTSHNAPGDDLNAVVWNGAFFVAVGNRGRIITSPDGITWTPVISGTTQNIADIAWSGANFIAVGAGGTILNSLDGILWTPRTSPKITNLNAVTFAGNFVAVGDADTILVSFNSGVTWSVAAASRVPGDPKVNLTDVGASSTTIFNSLLAVGANGQIFQPLGALNWGAPILTNANSYSAIANSAGTIGVIPYVIVGSDGTIATATTNSSVTTQGLWDVVWSASLSLFVGVGQSGTIVTSLDGITWIKRISGTTATLRSVIWTGTKFVALDFSGGTTLTSTDGITWTVIPMVGMPAGALLYDIAFTGTQYIIVGDIRITPPLPIPPVRTLVLTSVDGINWTQQTTGTTEALLTVMWSGAQFIAGGGNGVIMTSLNGVTWTQQLSASAGNVSDIIWTGSQYVAVGSDIQTSPDGASWALQSSSVQIGRKVVWTGSEYLVVGNNMLVSSDSVTWVNTTWLAAGSDLQSVVWSGAKFVGVGGGGRILYSPL